MALARTPGNRLGAVRQTPYPVSANSSGPEPPFKIVQDSVESPGRGSCENDAKSKIPETIARNLRIPLSEFPSAGNWGTPTIATYVGKNEFGIADQVLREVQKLTAPNVEGKKQKIDQESKEEDGNVDTDARCEKKPRTSSALNQAQEQNAGSDNIAELHTPRGRSPRSSNSLGSAEVLAEIDSIFTVTNTHAKRPTETFGPLRHTQKAEEVDVSLVSAKGEQSNWDEQASVQNTALPASFRHPQALSNFAQGLPDASSTLAASSTSEPPPSTMEGQPDAPGFGGWVITPESSPGGTLYPVSNEECVSRCATAELLSLHDPVALGDCEQEVRKP